MKVVALISGGKDSCYNMMQCVAEGHDIVALANLKPKDKDELDSYMYQTVGHQAIELYAEAMSLRLYRRVIEGSSKMIGDSYQPTANDEVEDLVCLLRQIKEELSIEAVSVGAILSDYQRVRVENVCCRLGLTCLAYLWRRDQSDLLKEMINCGVVAVLIKVAGLGLDPKKHLGKTLGEIYPHMVQMNERYGLNICGEGGEYETFTLDCPLFNRKIVIDESERVLHSDDAFAPVGYLNLVKLHLEEKNIDASLSYKRRIEGLPMLRSEDVLQEIETELTDMVVTKTTPYSAVTHEESVMNGDPCGQVDVVRKVTSDGQFWISCIHAVRQPDTDITQQAQEAMDLFNKSVRQCGAEMTEVVTVCLYVQSLADFVAINTVYKQSFGINPPCRVCVQACLPSDVSLQIDCYGWSGSKQASEVRRKTMHVQGISHWAPANIGPYSQAVRVNNRVYVAGQIPLCAGSMKIVRGGILHQTALALRHVTRILTAMGAQSGLASTTLSICYITHRNHITPALQVWDATLKKQRADCDAGSPGSEPLVTCVVVPELPRHALVEWQVYADPPDGESDSDSITSACRYGEVTQVQQSFRVCLQYRHHQDTPLSVLGHVCRLKDTLSVGEVINSIFKAYAEIEEHLEIQLSDLPGLKMFYKCGIFTHRMLSDALKASVVENPDVSSVPVSLVPVLELSAPDIVLTVCH
ncbi:uncharacterized protein LOC135467923 [Liolophura sinensis]|uniref:uncharacterized protein LOC135467923 n=1 Tax=Liolophura sinensis TaxID=3198878 RepID=UPI0031592538